MSSDDLVLVSADLQVVPASDGGRKSGISRQYRSVFSLAGETSECMIDEIAGGVLSPGEHGTAKILLSYPERHSGKLKVGVQFELHEGFRPIARGTILSVE